MGENETSTDDQVGEGVAGTGIQAGMRLDDFELLTRLGIGAMGEVWLAYQHTMGRKVALKLLSPELLQEEDAVPRFQQEARTLAGLQHPRIVTVYGVGEDLGLHYMVVAYVNGHTLEERLESEGILPEDEVLRVAEAVTDALEYAWREFRLLHRDVKPSNIMQDHDGNVVLMDLGIAKNMGDDPSLTSVGVIIGTPYYMSPERGRAEKDIDFRSDIYSLGATMYHLVTGTLPYDAESGMGVLVKHASMPFPDPRRRHPQVTPACVTLLRSMMAKDARDRPGSWVELKEALQVVARGASPKKKTPGKPKAAVARRWRPVVVSGAPLPMIIPVRGEHHSGGRAPLRLVTNSDSAMRLPKIPRTPRPQFSRIIVQRKLNDWVVSLRPDDVAKLRHLPPVRTAPVRGIVPPAAAVPRRSSAGAPVRCPPRSEP